MVDIGQPRLTFGILSLPTLILSECILSHNAGIASAADSGQESMASSSTAAVSDIDIAPQTDNMPDYGVERKLSYRHSSSLRIKIIPSL